MLACIDISVILKHDGNSARWNIICLFDKSYTVNVGPSLERSLSLLWKQSEDIGPLK